MPPHIQASTLHYVSLAEKMRSPLLLALRKLSGILSDKALVTSKEGCCSGSRVIADGDLLACRKAWLLPVLAPLLPHVLARLSNNWGRVVASTGSQAAIAAANGARTMEASSAAEDDVIVERQLHELTTEHFSLLAAIQDSCEPAQDLPALRTQPL